MLDFAPELTRDSDPGSGANSREWFASYDRSSSSWKMSQGSLFEAWGEYSATWPRSGMTRSGRAFEQPTWVRPIAASECSLWLTPRAQEDGTTVDRFRARMLERGARAHQYSSIGQQVAHLETTAVQIWPTPTEGDASAAGNRNLPGSKAHAGLSLTDVVTGGQAPRTRHGGASLSHFLQTGERTHDGPRDQASHSTPGNRPASSVVLNPAWVSCLMGFPPDWCDIGEVPLPRSEIR